MIPERLHAFGHLVQHAEKPSGIFVTDNRSVMEYLLEKSPQMKRISNAEALLPAAWSDRMVATMGTMLLLYAIRQGYAYATAEKDLVKQYDFMLRIFYNARWRLDLAADAAEKRQVLLALGDSALDEHAQWILMHRDRSIDDSEVWRMGS